MNERRQLSSRSLVQEMMLLSRLLNHCASHPHKPIVLHLHIRLILNIAPCPIEHRTAIKARVPVRVNYYKTATNNGHAGETSGN